MSVNSTLRQKQTYAHFSHVKGCKTENHTRPQEEIDLTNILTRLLNVETTLKSIKSCDCPDYSEDINYIINMLNDINADICEIQTYIENNTKKITDIEDNIKELWIAINNITSTDLTNLIDRTTTLENNAKYSIAPRLATSVLGSDMTFDSILSNVNNMSEEDLNMLYDTTISKGLPANDSILSVKQPLREEQNMITPDNTILNDACSLKWEQLTTDQKKAYTIQWYLADPSNQIRALYLINELLAKFIPDRNII